MAMAARLDYLINPGMIMVDPTSPSSISAGAGKKEWSVLLECASPIREARRLGDLVRSCDGPRLLALAEEHGMAGHLAAALRDLGGDWLATETKFALSERQRAQLLFSLRMTAELFRILERFASVGIGALAVKGPVLSVRAYGDSAMRAYGDLDLLVRHRDIRRATESLMASGYGARVPITAIDAGKIPGQYLFHNPVSKLLVELHNDRTLRYFPRPLPLEEFFARQVRVSVDGHDIPALSAEDELVLICIHGAKHFWERLLWIADVAALITHQASLDWERATETAKEVGAERILHTGLRLAADLLNARLPEPIFAKVNSDRAAAGLVRRIARRLPGAGAAPPGLFERALFRMRMRGSWLAAPAYLWRLSFSPTEEDWEEGGEISQHGFLDALRRPFRLARKYGRGGNP
jgi:hypothetical protein